MSAAVWTGTAEQLLDVYLLSEAAQIGAQFKPWVEAEALNRPDLVEAGKELQQNLASWWRSAPPLCAHDAIDHINRTRDDIVECCGEAAALELDRILAEIDRLPLACHNIEPWTARVHEAGGFFYIVDEVMAGGGFYKVPRVHFIRPQVAGGGR